jgi:hypothetical protein
MTFGRMLERSRLGLSVSAVLAAVIALFYRVALTDQIFFSRDIQRVYYPLKRYWADRIGHGEFPQWFPYDGLGQPFVGMVISGAFHPSNLLYLSLPLGTALKLNVLLCYPVAFFGTYLFARRWSLSMVPCAVAAVLFSFNGYMISVTNNLLYLMAAATLPWALWAADRFFAAPSISRGMAGSSLLALIPLAGDAQSFLLAAVSIGVLLLIRHQPGQLRSEGPAFFALIGVASLFSAAQILPAVQLFPETVTSLRSLESALLWSMHPIRLLELVWGPLFGGQSGSEVSASIDLNLLKTGMSTLWAESVHFGVAGVTLALIALYFHRRDRRAWGLILCGSVLLLLIFGKFIGLYALLFRLLPLWRGFRYPEKMLPYLLFLLAIAAAFGLEFVFRNPTLRRRLAVVLAIAGAVSLLFFGLEAVANLLSQRILAPVWAAPPSPEALVRLHRTFLKSTAQSAAVAGCLAALLWALSQRPGWVLLIPAICFADLAIANESMYEVTFPNLLHTPTAFVSAIQKREGRVGLGGYRVVSGIQEHQVPILAGLTLPDGYAISLASALVPDIPSLWGLESADAYLPAQSKRFYQLTEEPFIWYLRFDGDFGARYTVLPQEFFKQVNGRKELVVMEHTALHLLLLQNPDAAPRASLKRSHCVENDQQAFKTVIARKFESGREAVVECRPTRLSQGYRPVQSDEARIESYAPERVEISVRNESPALLVINDAFYQGWSAIVDGKAAEIVPANYAVRGIELDGGQHKVVLSYRTPGLMVGICISLFSLLAATSALVIRRFLAVGSQKTSPLPIPIRRS